jgi:hypothetical protein
VSNLTVLRAARDDVFDAGLKHVAACSRPSCADGCGYSGAALTRYETVIRAEQQERITTLTHALEVIARFADTSGSRTMPAALAAVALGLDGGIDDPVYALARTALASELRPGDTTEGDGLND